MNLVSWATVSFFQVRTGFDNSAVMIVNPILTVAPGYAIQVSGAHMGGVLRGHPSRYVPRYVLPMYEDKFDGSSFHFHAFVILPPRSPFPGRNTA